MSKKKFQITEQVWRNLELVHDDALHEVTDLKLALDRMKLIEGALKDLLSALADSRVFRVLELMEKEGELLTEYWISRGQDPESLRDIESQVEEAAQRTWLDYPKLLEEACRDSGLPLDARSRHPNYRFFDGFLLVKIEKRRKAVAAVLTTSERKLAEFPADVQAVLERVKKEGERLFGRPYDGQKLLRTIRRHYLELLDEHRQSDGSPVPFRQLSSRIIKSLRGYRPDEFIVDLSRLAREGPAEIDGKALHLRGTRDDKNGIMLHNITGLGYVGSLRFTRR